MPEAAMQVIDKRKSPYQLSDKRKARLAAVATLASVSLLLYMMTPSGPVGPPYRDESLTAGPEPLMLLNQTSVQQELRLSEVQIEQIKAVVEQQSAGKRGGKDAKDAKDTKDAKDDMMTAPRAARMGRRHQEAFLSGVLQPAQAQRLRQIILQRQGGLALATKQTADEVGLSEAQREQADTIVAGLAAQLKQPQGARGPEGRKQLDEARDAAKDKLVGLLTAEQQARWTELAGAPFAGEIRLGPPGGGPKGGPGGGKKGGPKGGPKGPPPVGGDGGPPPAP
jgi:hypothetical protein